MRFIATAFVFVFSAILVPASGAQQPPKAQTQTKPPAPASSATSSAPPSPSQGAKKADHIALPTRLVSILAGMEKQLNAGIQKKDKASITSVLTDDFEVWTPNQTGAPIPIEDWIQEMTGDYNLKSSRISEMSAKDFGEVVLFKFVANIQADLKGKDQSGQYFVVDAWKKEGDAWKLSDRYISKIGAYTPPAPARPTGKE
jgi:hypothetical protein